MATSENDPILFNYASLCPELLQVVGSRLSTAELRNARLVCTGWARALAHCMPAVTVALPRQASDHIFRQPLVLCSSGVLNSAQCQHYSAVPRSSHCQHGSRQPLLGICRRRSSRSSLEGCSTTTTTTTATTSCCKRACTASTISHSSSQLAHDAATDVGTPLVQEDIAMAEADGVSGGATEPQPVARDKPSPFATEMGQAVLDCLLEDPLLTAGTAATKGGGGATASAAAAAAALASASGVGFALATTMMPHRVNSGIKAAISMPPTLAEQAVAAQQQQAMQLSSQQMRKLSSVPASNAHPLPRTTRISNVGIADVHRNDQQQHQHGAAAAAVAAAEHHHHVVTTAGPVIQGWSSLPTAGLRTCSSLKQLNLKLSGAPPSPADILDLSKLLHLTHLSFKQVEVPDTDDLAASSAMEEDAAAQVMMQCSSSPGATPSECATPAPDRSAASCPGALVCGLKRSHSVGPVRLQPGMRLSSCGGDLAAATAAAALECCHIDCAITAVLPACSPCSQLPAAPQQDDVMHLVSTQGVCAGYGEKTLGVDISHTAGAALLTGDSKGGDGVLTHCAADHALGATDGAHYYSPSPSPSAGSANDDDEAAPTHSISCSVITVEHVLALAQLPYLSSLELAPKHGNWDAAGREGLLHLVKLTGLTRLSITWGDAAAATTPLSSEDAATAAQGDQLPLQQCLAGLTGLQELSVKGAAVVDVAVLQRLQQLHTLTAEGLQVVNSDVMLLVGAEDDEQEQHSNAQQAQPGGVPVPQQHPYQAQPVLGAAAEGAGAVAAGAGAAAGAAGVQQQQQQQGGRWASLPHLQCVHAVHPASDISLLLQSTLTPQLSHLGFVSRGPSDFARLLGQHGKLRTLHLAFAEEESWHPIAVVRLPTALPSLQSLTIDGKFWLPNSLIVALGVMEVPLEHLSLTCRLAPPCLQRLQHLKRLKRLALHHVPGGPGTSTAPGTKAPGKGGKGGSDVTMLQLPAKLLPPQLQELEISNGWILH